MAIDSNTKIRLVGTQNFAYATGNSYTQGHVHFTTDDHGSIVVNGKVYGTTDASYVYVGDQNIPSYVAYNLNLSFSYTDGRIIDLNGNTPIGTGSFISNVNQEHGNITAYRDTLQTLVTIYNDDDNDAYKPSRDNRFITNVEISGDTVYAYWDNFNDRVLEIIPSISIDDQSNKTNSYYIPKFTASDHKITISDDTNKQVASYADFKDLKNVVDTFFSNADLDTESVTSYIDTLAEIQTAFKNSYAYTISKMQESISRCISIIDCDGGYGDNNTYSIWISYRANGDDDYNQAYAHIPVATKDCVGLVKYDDTTIKKTEAGYLYVNGELTDTIYSLDAGNNDDSAYIKLKGTDDTSTTVKFVGTGIANVSYDSTDKIIKINVPESAINSVVNYNHHSTANGTIGGDITLDSEGASSAYVISYVSLSADGKLTYTYNYLKHEKITLGGEFNHAGGNTDGKLSNGKIYVPNITFNSCGHITAYENVIISGIAAEDHTHDEFVWL